MSQGGVVDFTKSDPEIPTQFNADVGSAQATNSQINILGTGTVATSGSGSTITITGASPANLNVVTDSGTAISSGDILQILGGSDISTSGSSNQVTINLTATLGTISSQNANSVSITGGTITGITPIALADGGTGSSTAAAARTSLGLGTISTQNANAVAITGGSVTGITDLTVADGGTGASSQTAYAVLCGGTTSTSPFQSIASVGTSGQILTSNGASALPTFQDAPAGSPSFGYRSGYYYFFSPIMTTASSTSATVAGSLYIVPFYITEDISIDRVAIEVSGASGASTNARLGLYNVANGRFTTVNRTFGTVATDSIGVKNLTVSESITAGYYGMAIQFEAGPSFYTNSTTSAQTIPLLTPSTSFSRTIVLAYIFNSTYASGLPDVSSSNPDFNTNSVPTMQFRIA